MRLRTLLGIAAGLGGGAALLTVAYQRRQAASREIHKMMISRDRINFYVSDVSYGRPCVSSDGGDSNRTYYSRTYYSQIVGSALAPHEPTYITPKGSEPTCGWTNETYEVTDPHRQIFETAQRHWGRLQKFFTLTEIRLASSCHPLTEADWRDQLHLKPEPIVDSAVICKLGASQAQPNGEATVVVESLHNGRSFSTRVYLNVDGAPQPPLVWMDDSWSTNVKKVRELHATGSSGND
ncbi:MAG: hypothetical protein HYT76_00620 [Deltaproteobacteria bacterium]|nr:hypothetical protein [Deltaproteobacteria bacterium]